MPVQTNKAAVFDFGEVLFETSRRAMYQVLFARQGRSAEDLDYFLKNILSSAATSIANTGTMHAVTSALAKAHPEWKNDILAMNADRNFIKQIRGTIDGMPEILQRAKARGYKVFGLTNWAADTFQTLRAAYPEILRNFDKVVVSGEVGIKKPSPAIFALAATEFGNPPPSQTYYFDDKVANIEMAHQTVGWNAHRFDRSNGAMMVLEKLEL